MAIADPSTLASIDMPESIISYVKTYSDCLDRAEERLSQEAGPLQAREMRGVVEGARRECADARRMARANALKAIASDASIAATSRDAVVDQALSDIDRSDEYMLQELERQESTKNP